LREFGPGLRSETWGTLISNLGHPPLWLAESEPSLTWLMLVSALETGANEWQRERGDSLERMKTSKPQLCDYLAGLEDKTVLRTVAEHLADSLGSTKKFVDFVIEFLPEPPSVRPPPHCRISWEVAPMKKAVRLIYAYRSKALHDGRPFPSPMSHPPYRDPSFQANSESVNAQAVSEFGAVWQKKDLPMNLHIFEYIARNVLVNWWRSCAAVNKVSYKR
jgi:hypothetical protein